MMELLESYKNRLKCLAGIFENQSRSFDNPYIFDNPKLIKMIEKAIEPSSFICTYVASAVKMLVGDNVKIYGFSSKENPDATYFVEENGDDSDEGHHFAVMNNRYIIDPWIHDNFLNNGKTINRSVFELQNKNDEKIIKFLYGDKNKWTNITNRVEDFKELFPKTYRNIINKFR